MNRKALLQADRMMVSFTLAKQEEGELWVQVHIDVAPPLCNLTLTSQRDIISSDEVRNLIGYLRNHIYQLKANPNHDSYVFMVKSLTFQLQALCGDVDEKDEGAFTIVVMVNPAQFDKRHARIYLGGKTEVTVKDIKNFITELTNFIGEFEEDF